MALNEQAMLAGRLLPYLRTRVFKGDPNWRIWTFKELSKLTLIPVDRVKIAVRELEKRAGVVFQIFPTGIRLIGPERIDLANAFKPGAAPSTPLAKAFRKHGVRLEKNLTPGTSWCRKSDESGDLVLTLDSNTIKYEGGKVVYDCSRKLFPERYWENLPASHARMKCLRCVFKDNGLVRVIRVDIHKFSEQTERILSADVDQCYWRIIRLDDEGNRFAVERTGKRARMYSLSLTELGA